MKLLLKNILLIIFFSPFLIVFFFAISIPYILFLIKCIFHPEQYNAFRDLASMAVDELARLKSLPIDELKSMKNSVSKYNIRGRNGTLSLRVVEETSKYIFLIYTLDFFNWDTTAYEVNAIGFRINNDNQIVDMTLLEVDEILNL